MCQRNREGSEGFTLMEIMVAMMILAMSLTVILQLFSAGLRSGELSRQYLRAVYYAETKLEEALLEENFLDEIRQGELADGYRWTTTVQPMGLDDIESRSSKYMLYKISVQMRWGGEQLNKYYTVETLQLGLTLEHHLDNE